ncbi:7TM GPCR domain containing protein [Trichostrongylus colubriformis]|uniref:7TM GPCR domain containing protein n=1 Tax=Trichostrongylus colubriformis TaxID=6319 RepID=A0AAN8IB55_TRICO
MLLAMNAFYHTVCLLSELVHATYIILGQGPLRRTCYNFMMACIFAMHQQAIMTTMISVDLLLALIFPFWYRIYPTKHYLIIIFMLCTTYALPISVWAWIGQDDEVVPFCSPPAAIPPAIAPLTLLSVTVLNFVTLAVYIAITVFLKRKGRSSTDFDTRKTLRRLKVIVLIYLCSWFATTSLGYCLQLFGFSAEDLIIWWSNLVLFALIAYSQTFYVCIWRSAEYRIAFKEQLSSMFFRASVSSTPTTTIQPSK